MDRVNRDRNRHANPLTAENALAAYDVVPRNTLLASPSKLPNPLPVRSNPLAIGGGEIFLLALNEIPWNRLHPSSSDLGNPLAAGSAPVCAPNLGSQQADPPAMTYPDNVLAYADSQKSDRAPTQVDPLGDRRDLGATLQPNTNAPYPVTRHQPPQQPPHEPATFAEVYARRTDYLHDKAQLSGAMAPVLQPTRRHAETVIDLIGEGMISVRVEADNLTAVVKIGEEVLRRLQRHKPTGVPDNELGVPSGSESMPHAVPHTEETSSAAKPPRLVDVAPRASAVDDDKPAPVPELEAELDAASAPADAPEPKTVSEQETPAAVVEEEPPTLDPRPQPTNPAVREWFKRREAGWPDHLKAPTEDEDRAAFSVHFASGLLGRSDFRDVRRQATSEGWHRRGPRKLWGEEKKSAANPPIRRMQN